MFKPLIYLFLFCVGSFAKEYTNPIAQHAPDPWMQYYKGYYYLVATTFTNDVGIKKAKTLSELEDAENQIVYSYDDDVDADCEALELHLIDGLWYLLYAACGPKHQGDRCHRNQVLQSATDDPMGPYTFMVEFDSDVEELDPSYIIINDKQYFLGSSYPWSDYIHGGLFIRPMTNPYTPAGDKYFLSQPTYEWESQGYIVNEGPEPLYHDGKIFVVYSASGCHTPNYKLGLLEFVGTDPLNSTHWYKYPEPVFQTSDENHVYGPGHNGFFKSPDGTEDWIIYHANSNKKDGCGLTRSARAQKFTWSDDGLPVFGIPEAEDVTYEGPSGEEV